MSYVVGTAGHIDHGKSTLIQALTGIDPDRLEEEKRRGMTIDLGFAYTTTPAGRLVGFVDVPGHARFIKNMLAGVHGMDAVLLVIAADEGVMPQTREHLQILRLLEVERGIVVLTKVDLVEADWLELVQAEVVGTLEGTPLAGAPMVPVSAVTGAGLDELRLHLDRLLEATPTRADRGRPRLPVDRVFSISGFGTVVTGTLVDGRMRVGEELELQPSGRRVRVRGLQQHNQRVEEALPGSRVAANLAAVEVDEVRRGEVLTRPNTLTATRRVDARVQVLADASRPLRHGAQLTLHCGTAEVAARAIVLEADAIEPGGAGWVQLYLAAPIAAASGDRFVLRQPSPSETLAGGRFADVNPRRHARHDSAVATSLENRLAGNELQEELRKYPRGISEAALVRQVGASAPELAALEARRCGTWLYSLEAWAALRTRCRQVLAAYHREHPDRPGMPASELRSRLALNPAAVGPTLVALVREGVVVEREAELALPGHTVRVDPASTPEAARLVELIDSGGFTPISLNEAMRESGAGPETLRALIRRGDVVRLSDEMAYSRPVYERALELVRRAMQEEGTITVARLRDLMGSSRRPVLALLEYLDGQKITRRVGDQRFLR